MALLRQGLCWTHLHKSTTDSDAEGSPLQMMYSLCYALQGTCQLKSVLMNSCIHKEALPDSSCPPLP